VLLLRTHDSRPRVTQCPHRVPHNANRSHPPAVICLSLLLNTLHALLVQSTATAVRCLVSSSQGADDDASSSASEKERRGVSFGPTVYHRHELPPARSPTPERATVVVESKEITPNKERRDRLAKRTPTGKFKGVKPVPSVPVVAADPYPDYPPSPGALTPTFLLLARWHCKLDSGSHASGIVVLTSPLRSRGPARSRTHPRTHIHTHTHTHTHTQQQQQQQQV
jgi:hypothetical protein